MKKPEFKKRKETRSNPAEDVFSKRKRAFF